MTNNHHYSATSGFNYSPERNAFIHIIQERGTGRRLVESAFNRVEFINLIREALREYEDNLGEPFPFEPWYEQEEERRRYN